MDQKAGSGMQDTEDGKAPQVGEPFCSVSPNQAYKNNRPIGRPWSTGLFDCHEDQTNAVMTAFLPCDLRADCRACYLGSLIYLLMMPGFCSQWLMGSKYRAQLRQKHNLVEAPYTDVISHLFCPCCSLCQEFRELRNQGLDPALGWNGILAKQSEDKSVVPPRTQTMLK